VLEPHKMDKMLLQARVADNCVKLAHRVVFKQIYIFAEAIARCGSVVEPENFQLSSQKDQRMEIEFLRAARRTWILKRGPLLLYFAALVVFSGCFHKDVATDRADDVEATILYTGAEGHFVITKEAIFQANSKSTEGGVTHISGYTEFRLTSYNLATGDQMGRVALGEMIEEANTLLGTTPGKVWMFSIDPEIGLHYRNPKTLEPVKTWAELSKLPGLSEIKPARPDWPLIGQYFKVDYDEQQVVLTDEAGFKYHLDPESFEVKKVDVEIRAADWDQNPLTGSGSLPNEKYVSLQGDPRKEISYLQKNSGAEVSFLFGQLFLDFDPNKAAQRKEFKRDSMERHWKALEDSVKIYSAAHPEANQEPDYNKWTWEQRDIHSHAVSLKQYAEYAKRDYESALRSGNIFPENVVLTTDGKSIYMHHANLVADTAHTLISRVNLQPDSSWKIAWTTHLPKFYHNYSKADQAGAFEEVYSKGNPTFDYQWAGTIKNYLVFISQLRMACLDTETGKLLWEKEL
jgi:hypothetical protein